MFRVFSAGWLFAMGVTALLVASVEWGTAHTQAQQTADVATVRHRALVLLSASDIATFNGVVELIRESGGEVPLAYPPTALVALLDAEGEDAVRRHPAVRGVETAHTSNGTATPLQARSAAPPDADPPPEPVASDLLIAPPASTLPGVPVPSSPGAPTPGQTSEFMAGTVVVSVVFVESAGTAGYCAPADAESEEWDAGRQEVVMAKIAEGLDFWTARTDRPEPLTFAIDPLGTVSTSCEPIARSSADQGRWTADVLTGLGYTATPSDYLTVARTLVHDCRAAFGADWGVLVLVVDSLNDVDGSHRDGMSGRAYLNGPIQYLTYDNGGWGIARLDRVFLHETGHTFGALDEYATSGCHPADSWGYLNSENASCNNGGVTDDVSVMGEGAELGNPAADVSRSARDAIGWRNPVGAMVDVVRTATISLFRSGGEGVTEARPLYVGVAGNSPFPPGECNRRGGTCLRLPQPVMISRVRAVRWRVDDQPFTRRGVLADDGRFDGESDGFSFMPLADLTPGSHLVRARAVNQFGHRSPPARDRVRIPSP